METVGHFIDGEHVRAMEGSAPVTNPSTGETIRLASFAPNSTVLDAVHAAQSAYPAWRSTPPAKRASIMFRYKSLLENNAEALAHKITEEHGKVFDDAMGEVARGIEIVEYACGAPKLLLGEYAKNVSSGIDSWSEFHPLGVAVGVTPFNFPAMVPLWMFPMALICGNTFVLKPSEKTPSVAIMLAEMAMQAGFPRGVFNVVNGAAEAVGTLLASPNVEAVSFVGSTPVAERIYQAATSAGKRVQALGGAKNHAVVLPDADLDNTANALMGAAFGSCGERCMAISVVACVGEAVADTLVQRLQSRIRNLTVGAGECAGVDMGPLVSAAHLAKVSSFMSVGLSEGAELICDGREIAIQGKDSGFFLGPSLFDRVTPGMRLYKEEIFGPVLCVVRVRSLSEALELANNHEFGNGACIFTNDGAAARYFTDNIKVGMAGVNVPLPVPAPMHSFGGWKRSLFGDLHAYGPDAIRFYTRRKTITQRWPSKGVEEIQYAFPSSA